MKKLFRFLILLTLYFACQGGRKINLCLNLKQGTNYKYRLTTEQNISQTVQGQKVDVNQTTIMECIYDVKEVDEAGNTTVKFTYSKIGFIQDGPLGRIEYKSWEKADEVPLMVKAFASLVDQSLTIEMSSKGKVFKISGAGILIEKMLKLYDIPENDEMMNTIKENLKNHFGDEAIKETMEKMFAIYPNKPVGVGDSWHAKFSLAKGFPMILSSVWKVRSIKDGKVYIDVYTKIEPNKEADVMQIGGAEMSYELSGEQKGSMLLDEATGWCMEAKMDQDFEGKVNVSGGMFKESQEWPINVSGSVTIETIKQ